MNDQPQLDLIQGKAGQGIDIQVGDTLKPLPLWNQTERGPNQLPAQVEVLETKHGRSQTGILIKVHSKNGVEQWLDAGWFEPIKEIGNMAEQRALAFKALPQSEALQQHPELIGAYEKLAAIGKMAVADGLSQDQQDLVLARTKINLAAAINKGVIPQLQEHEAGLATTQDSNNELFR